MACYNFLLVVFHPREITQPNRDFELQLLLSGHVSEAPSGASSSQLERGPGKHTAPTRFLRPGNHGVRKKQIGKKMIVWKQWCHSWYKRKPNLVSISNHDAQINSRGYWWILPSWHDHFSASSWGHSSRLTSYVLPSLELTYPMEEENHLPKYL